MSLGYIYIINIDMCRKRQIAYSHKLSLSLPVSLSPFLPTMMPSTGREDETLRVVRGAENSMGVGKRMPRKSWRGKREKEILFVLAAGSLVCCRRISEPVSFRDGQGALSSGIRRKEEEAERCLG